MKGQVFIMVKFILGAKGVGKTRWLVDNANEEFKKGNGNIVLIDVDDEHIFTLDYQIRLINAMEFDIKNIESFYGFLCGILSMDHDLEKIYIDSIYRVINIDIEKLRLIHSMLKFISDKFDVKIYMNAEFVMGDIPEDLKSYCYEVK